MEDGCVTSEDLEFALDSAILKLAIDKLSLAFDEFISACIDESGDTVAPSAQSLAKARGYLPPDCRNAYKKRV